MEVLETILPILVLSAWGYLAIRCRFLNQNQFQALSKLTFQILVPTLLFSSASRVRFPETIDWNFLIGYYLSVLIIYIIAVVWSRHAFRYQAAEQSVIGMGASYSNVTIIGIPVCLHALGESSMLPLFMIISVHNLTLFLVGILVAERHSLSPHRLAQTGYALGASLLKSPIVCGILLGLALNLSGISLYAPLAKSVSILAGAAIPMALLVLGGSLCTFGIKGNLPPALMMVALKNIGLPALVWFFSTFIFSIEPLWAATSLLAAAMPMGINAFIFSQKYAAGEQAISSGIAISTLVSIVTLSAFIALSQRLI